MPHTRSLMILATAAAVAVACRGVDAQMGQMGMAPASGVANRAVAGFSGGVGASVSTAGSPSQ